MLSEYSIGDILRVNVGILDVSKHTASNGPYLTMTVYDKKHKFIAKYWQYPYKDLPETNKVYYLIGTVSEWNGKRDLNITRMLPLDESIESYRPVGRYHPDDVWRELMDRIEDIENEELRGAVSRLFHENVSALSECPAAKKNHHANVGGLLEHTLEVVTLAQNFSKPLNKDLVTAGAALHDFGKLLCYKWDGCSIVETDRGKLLGHIALGYEWWSTVDIDSALRDQVGHIILSHHGKMEWGSPVVPMTTEAILVHQADMMSSQVMMAVEAVEGCNSDWTDKIWPLGRELYAGRKEG